MPESDGNCASEWFATVRFGDFLENPRLQPVVRTHFLKNEENGTSAERDERLSQEKTRIK